jgi:hypothetical protein
VTSVIFIDMTNRLNVSFLPVLYILFIGLLVRIFQPIEDPKSVYVDKVENKVIIGKLANNRNLAFGAKNIFQEVLQDKDYVIVEDASKADLIFSAEILFFDVNKTKTNISVFHSDKEETLVVMRGKLTTKEGKKIKEAVAEESSSEISTSTLITDEGDDKINQQALSSAIKKTCESLINKVFSIKK